MYLNCKTYYSFNYGTYPTEELVKAAVEKNARCIAITNINNTSDVWDVVKHCRKYGIKPIAGVEIRNQGKFKYVLLAKNNTGLRDINRFLSQHLQQRLDFPDRPQLQDVFIIYPLEYKEPSELTSYELLGVQATQINQLFGKPVQQYPDKYVILQPVTVQNRQYYELHKLLRAIDLNTLLSQLTPADSCQQHEFFVAPAKLLERFASYPSIVTNTLRLQDACSIDMEFHTDKTKRLYSSSAEGDRELLQMLALDGLKRRYGSKDKSLMTKKEIKLLEVATRKVAEELVVINQMGFNAYYLITWDVIRYAKSKGFFHVGRGSGANSIVAYCLEITEVEPIELNLFFERFLNEHRSSPPDFDIDFSWKDRDEIIRYIITRYGSDYVCLLGSFTTYRRRAATRELGKVFGLPPDDIKNLQSRYYPVDSVEQKILTGAKLILDAPNNLSIHAGGMLVSEQPIYTYTATVLPPKNFPVSQIDMYTAEDIGLFKLDILSQRGLGHIKEAVELILHNKGIQVDIQQTAEFKTDKGIIENLRKGNTIGCFYIESPGMRQLLEKLDCKDYPTLVAASSIIRPGVSQSGMMEQYIFRHRNPGKFSYIHPSMIEILGESYDIPIYQEHVIRIGHEFAGLDKGKCDKLRKGMSGKSRGINPFVEIYPEYLANCRERGYPEEIIAEVWRRLESFAGYSFSKAHSASFAVESLQSLMLKTYHPQEFYVAVLNNNGGFYSKEVYYHELVKSGADVRPPCVNSSDLVTNITGSVVHLGLYLIKDLEATFMNAILQERSENGLYEDLGNFITRLQPDLQQLNLLIKIDAFRFTGRNKKELLWQAAILQKKGKSKKQLPKLFDEKPIDFQLPDLHQDDIDNAIDQIELINFPLCNPFLLVDDDPARYVLADQLHAHVGETVTMLLYLVTIKESMTKHNAVMNFGTFYDPAMKWVDTIHWPAVLQQYPLTGKGFYRITGKVTLTHDVHSIEVITCEKVGIKASGQKADDLFRQIKDYKPGFEPLYGKVA